MKIVFAVTGRTTESFILEGCGLYEKRILKYCPYQFLVLPAHGGSSLSPREVMLRESEAQLKLMTQSDFSVLLDEHGKEMPSVGFANFLQQRMNQGIRQLAFFVGGSYGFDPQVKQRADVLLALSALTFPHQLVRLIFLEQLYRGFTILRNEPYHHT